MPITINGSGTVTGLAVGGLPDGSVDADTLAANAVTTVKILDDAVTSAKSTISGGISEFDMWSLTDSLTGNQLPITTSDIERVDDVTFTKLGTGMSCSSGVFTFPSTGIWRVTWNATIESGVSTHHNTFTTEVSSDNGSSWDTTCRTKQGIYKQSTGNSWCSASSSCIVDVQNISGGSTVKVRFEYIAGQGSEKLIGDSTVRLTTFEFIKLAET